MSRSHEIIVTQLDQPGEIRVPVHAYRPTEGAALPTDAQHAQAIAGLNQMGDEVADIFDGKTPAETPVDENPANTETKPGARPSQKLLAAGATVGAILAIAASGERAFDAVKSAGQATADKLSDIPGDAEQQEFISRTPERAIKFTYEGGAPEKIKVTVRKGNESDAAAAREAMNIITVGDQVKAGKGPGEK